MPTKPLHPEGNEHVFQHPIKGCVFAWPSSGVLECFANDYMKGSSPDDTKILIGQPAATRLKLGEWVAELHPRVTRYMQNQKFVDNVLPNDWSRETDESVRLIERVDMAISVRAAGGYCTICGVPKTEPHKIGCEVLSFTLHALTNPPPGDGEPSLDQAIQAANEQIARMK